MKDDIMNDMTQELSMAAGYQEIKIPKRPIEAYLDKEYNRLKDQGCDCVQCEAKTDGKIVYVKARAKGTVKVHTYKFIGGLPKWFTHIGASYGQHVWDYVEIIDPTPSSASPIAGYDEYKVTKRNNTQHKEAGLTLYTDVSVTCEETGITHKVNLPVPGNFNYPVMSPLASYQTVQDVLRSYSEKGWQIEKVLEPQMLAGMLITILRHKQLLIHCKDPAKANAYLRAARQETLAWAIRWFNARNSVLGMPKLSLEIADNLTLYSQLDYRDIMESEKRTYLAENTIIQYLKACRGDSGTEDTSIQRAIDAKAKAKVKGKVKVYTDNVVKEVKQVEKGEKEAKVLLAKLISEYPGQHSIFFNSVKANIGILAFMSDDKRTSFAARIKETLIGNPTAQELANIFAHTSTDAIEDDLLSFTHQFEKERDDYIASKGTKTKVDFLSKLKNKG